MSGRCLRRMRPPGVLQPDCLSPVRSSVLYCCFLPYWASLWTEVLRAGSLEATLSGSLVFCLSFWRRRGAGREAQKKARSVKTIYGAADGRCSYCFSCLSCALTCTLRTCAALVFWWWDRTRDDRSAVQWALLGAGIGLAMLVRPSNIALCVLPAADDQDHRA